MVQVSYAPRVFLYPHQEEVYNILEKYYPQKQILPRTAYLLEELLAKEEG
ncbi:MAG: hypothetical protein RLZ12_643 [Bacillota bacterium]|jgi:hypothetical protein